MSQATGGTAPATTTATSQPGALGVAYIRGRIEFLRRSPRKGVTGVLTLLALPAPTQFDHPATVEVWSRGRLGEVGAEVSVKVQIGGYPRSYETRREDEDGRPEKVTIRTADNTLTVVE